MKIEYIICIFVVNEIILKYFMMGIYGEINLGRST